MITFRLKDVNSKKETPIRMTCFFEGVRIQIYSGLKILPSNWIQTTQKATTNLKEFKHGRQFNYELEKVRNVATTLALAFKESGTKITMESFKQKFDEEYFGRDSFKTVQLSILTQYEKYIQEMSIKRGYSKLSSHRNAVQMIKRFCPDWEKLQYKDINIKFHSGLVDFIIYKEGLSLNYAGSITARIKTFMNVALMAGEHSNQDFRQFKKLTSKVDTIALSTDDIKALMGVILSGGHDIARDMFLVQCLTGLRFSDSSVLTRTNNNGKILEVTTMKTDTRVNIPIHADLWKIIDKYDGFPPPITNQKVNVYIKEVAEFAKLNRKVNIKTSVRGQTVNTEYKLWELRSTHTGRRTALTNMARAEISLYDIMKISGHATIRQLQDYLKFEIEETAIKLLDHPYYKSIQ